VGKFESLGNFFPGKKEFSVTLSKKEMGETERARNNGKKKVERKK
jgi:hypothetical protein